MFKVIAVLTSKESWFRNKSMDFARYLTGKGYEAKFCSDHNYLPENVEIVFALSYFTLIPTEILNKTRHTLVVHASRLPKGRGWAPLFWQVLEGKNTIPICLFEAKSGADTGDIWIEDKIQLSGYELHDEIREIQANKTCTLCERFLEEYHELKPVQQQGGATYYSRRGKGDHRLDPDKTIREQFNLLRISSNTDYPAFFEIKGKKYLMRIEKEG